MFQHAAETWKSAYVRYQPNFEYHGGAMSATIETTTAVYEHIHVVEHSSPRPGKVLSLAVASRGLAVPSSQQRDRFGDISEPLTTVY